MAGIYFPEKIKVLLDDVVDDIVIELDPLYVLIAGSFGKGSWLYDNQQLLSDFELVFVSGKKWSLNKKKKLLASLNSKYKTDISLKGYLLEKVENKIISNYSRYYPGYVDLNFFDTFSRPYYLYRKEGIQKELTVNMHQNEIPVWEAWRLFVNRIGEYLEYKEKNNTKSDYLQIKIWESAADTYLIINKNYNSDINNRLDFFLHSVFSDLEIHNKKLINVIPLMRKALITRKNHTIERFSSNSDSEKLMFEWLKYLERELSKVELIIDDKNKDFYSNYMLNYTLQGKYLGFISNAKIKSNLVRLIHHRDLVNNNFRFYRQSISWKHFILLSVSAYFSEMNNPDDKFINTRKILSHLFDGESVRNWSDKILITNILEYWKRLR